VICGTAEIGGRRCCLFLMDPGFMMARWAPRWASAYTRTFENATERRLPVVGFTGPGGARMQEGLFSLMQMAKTSGAVQRHSDAGLFYLRS
jgi:acetyl-CoA carboxylase carboxyl transferase subunit beta